MWLTVVSFWFFQFDFDILIISSLERYLKIFVWVKKDIIFKNMYSKLAKIARQHCRQPAKKTLKIGNLFSNVNMMT
jgi:hypothetical protein